MEIKKGIGVSPGLAISTALVLDAEEVRIPQRTILPAEIPKELARLRQALAQSTTECKRLREELSVKANPQTAKIFDVHIGFLRDPSVRREITQAIRQHHYTAEYAVSTVMRQYADLFLKMPDPYMAERVKDIHDIERRLLRNLIGQRREDLTRLVARYRDVPPDYASARVQRFELTGRQIILYVSDLTSEAPLTFSYRLRARFPVVAQVPASMVYDYYNPQMAGEARPLTLAVTGP